MTTKIQYENIQQATLNVIDSPKITAITYPGDDTAADTAGGQTITITGSNFLAGASVIINGAAVGVVSVVSANSITFTSPAQSSGSYPLYVVNTNGGTAVAIPGIQYSGTPTWTTAAGSLGSYTETQAIANTVTATGDAPITYSLYSGTLPTGATLNTSNGYISGTSPLEASPTTFTFTIRATDAQQQDTDRQFSLTINPDVVTWSSPANGTTYTSNINSAISNVTMSASAASGQTITYTANALPTGLSISGSNITGTPTVVANSSSLLTATAATTNATATRTISWVIQTSVDTYWPYVSLLLSANTPSSTFVADASTNNFAITVNGDTKPNNLNPYTPGYYSNYFDGTGDYLTIPNNSAFALPGDFTIELWANFNTNTTSVFCGRIDSSGNGDWGFIYNNAAGIRFITDNVGTIITGTYTVTLGTWTHIAISRSGTSVKIFANGVLLSTTTNSSSNGFTGTMYIGSATDGGLQFPGYMSNLRIVKGTAVYTSAFTPPTSPLTAIANTSLLTCQSNRFIDNSTNNFTITKNGDTTVSGFIPFTPNSSYNTYGSGYFSGSGSLTAASNTAFSLTGDFTIECWVYLTSASGTKTVYTNRTSYANATGLAWVTQSGSQAMSIYTASAFSLTSSISIPLNAWTHIALTRSGSTMTQWVNGVSGGTATISNSFTDAQCYIGVNNSSGEYWPGYITDFRIVKGSAVYTTTFTPPTSPLTAIANTSLLTLQNNQTITNNTFIDNSTNNYLITRNGNPTSGTFSPYAGTWSNYFSATGDNLRVGTTTALGISFTLECWIFPTSFANYRLIWDNRTSDPDTVGFAFGLDGNAKVYIYTNNLFQLTTTTALSANTWTHLALVRNGSGSSNLKIYINGVADATTGTYATSFTRTAVYIGNDFDGTGAPFNGYISNLRTSTSALYTTTFTPSTTPLVPGTYTNLLTCQSNRLVDNSINNSSITVSGSYVQKFSPFDMQTTTVPTSYGVIFNGSSDYLSVASNAAFNVGSGAYTVECWLYQYARNATAGGFFTLRNADDTSFPDLCVTSTGALQGFMSGGAQGSASTSTVPLNTWTHVAWVRNSGTVYYYINGVASGSTSQSTTWSGTTPKVGGQGWASAYCFNGLISNLRFVNGIAVYTGAFTVPTSPLAATQSSGTNISALTGTQTTLLTCQNSTIIDNSTNVWTVSAVSSPKVNINNPFGYTNPSAAAYTVSSLGGSMYFDGSGDYLTLPAAPMNLTSTTWTIEYWIYPTVISSATYYALWAIQGSYNGLTQAIYGDSGTHYLTVLYSGAGLGTMNLAAINKVIVLNQWHHIALVNNGTTIQQYCNGIALGNASAASYSSTTPLIGSWGAANYYNGYMSDFRVFKGTAKYISNFVPPAAPMTALQNTTILLNGTSAGIYDSSMCNDFETVGDTQISTAVKKYGNASMYFDGTGDYLQTSGNSAFAFKTGDFTIEGWVYITGSVGNKGIFQLATSILPSANNGLALAVFNDSGNGWTIYYANGSQTNGGGSSTSNVWYHFALVRYGTSLKLYINGSSVISVTDSTSYTGTSLAIGGYYSTGYLVQGYMDDFRITSGYARYTTNFTAPTSPFVQF